MKLLYFLFLFSIITNAQNKPIPFNYEQDSVVFKNTINKALFFYKEKKLDSFKKYSLLSLKQSKKPINLQKAHNYLATYYKLKEISDSAYYHYNESKNILLELGDSITAGKRLYYIAFIQLNQNDLLASEISHIEALKALEKENSENYKHQIYNNLGIISDKQGNIEEALKYYDLSLEELKKDSIENIGLELNVINNKGLLYQRLKQHKKAITYFNKGLNFDSIKKKHPRQYGLLLENLAVSNYYLNKKRAVLNQYHEVLKIREELYDISDASITHTNISYFYEDSKQYNKAKYHSKKALTYAKQARNYKTWLEALRSLSELTSGEQSKQYLQEYIKLKDSLFEKDRKLKNQFAKIKYQTNKKEKENVILKSENEKTKIQVAYHKQQQTIGWLAAAIGLLLFFISIFFFFYRKKRILYQAQLERIDARSHERKQIAKSLHDEVAGDLGLLHQRLKKSNLLYEADKLETIKENVRNLSHQLNSTSFSKVSFKNQIINLVSDYYELNFKITVIGLQEHNWKIINNTIKRLLYLCTREAIQNCKKYAQAKKITVTFKIDKKYVLLTIIDDGIGFDTSLSRKGDGLQNLQERIEELNGIFYLESKISSGTQISIKIPRNA
ncbi:tetratricopeptide repeat protein [Tenacibaculum aestuariivivum]|uniref:ATP-binding protein n=1 Tax=Tenacibaculum aestuariivivum TaxID=2006131 RepID=UPI003AB71221